MKALREGCLYRVTHRKYPLSDEERDAAIRKAKGCVGQRNYSLGDGNCQHFVNNMLMNERRSMDIEETKVKRLIASIVDSLSQLAGKLVHFLRPHLERMSVWILEQLQACCKSGFLKTVFGAIGDDTAEYMSRMCQVLASPELTPLQRVVKDGGFALLIEFIVFTIQTCVELYRLNKGTKSSKEIAPVLIKRFLAMFGGAAGVAAGSAIAAMVLGLAPYTCGFIVCQAFAGIAGHVFGYYFGSWLSGGWLQNITEIFLEWLDRNVLTRINRALHAVGEKIEEILHVIAVKVQKVVNLVESVVSRIAAAIRDYFPWW